MTKLYELSALNPFFVNELIDHLEIELFFTCLNFRVGRPYFVEEQVYQGHSLLNLCFVAKLFTELNHQLSCCQRIFIL